MQRFIQVHARVFLSNIANGQTDGQTNKRGQTHLPPPLSDVISATDLAANCN